MFRYFTCPCDAFIMVRCDSDHRRAQGFEHHPSPDAGRARHGVGDNHLPYLQGIRLRIASATLRVVVVFFAIIGVFSWS